MNDFSMICERVVVETDAGTVNIQLPSPSKGGFTIVNTAEGAEINGVLFGPGDYKIDDEGNVLTEVPEGWLYLEGAVKSLDFQNDPDKC